MAQIKMQYGINPTKRVYIISNGNYTPQYSTYESALSATTKTPNITYKDLSSVRLQVPKSYSTSTTQARFNGPYISLDALKGLGVKGIETLIAVEVISATQSSATNYGLVAVDRSYTQGGSDANDINYDGPFSVSSNQTVSRDFVKVKIDINTINRQIFDLQHKTPAISYNGTHYLNMYINYLKLIF